MCLYCECGAEPEDDNCCRYCRGDFDATLDQWGRDYASAQMESFNNEKPWEVNQAEG